MSVRDSMQAEQITWSEPDGWASPSALSDAQLVLVFGDRAALAASQFRASLQERWPKATVIGCSTAGQIHGTEVFDAGLVATAVRFDHTRVRIATAAVNVGDSAAAGAALAGQLAAPDLVHMLIISEGLDINGEALVRGIGERLGPSVSVSGGLSADGEHFRETTVLVGNELKTNTVAAIGLYGSRLKVGCGSLGGWDSFGPERQITRSAGNVLYELDGQSALALYKRYLGEHAADLPASGLLFPLSLRTRQASAPVVRTILSVNEADQSLTFAGDVPIDGYVRLMKANFDRLIDGAVGAGRVSAAALGTPVDLALSISCVGRRMVLRQRVEEEGEGDRDIVGPGAAITGFYSYGEISPFTPKARCELHNQTMTVTTLSEQ
ncbi:MAG: FIST signal transduction protein [Acidimicrobiia bacterium]